MNIEAEVKLRIALRAKFARQLLAASLAEAILKNSSGTT